MTFTSLNPFTQEVIATYESHSDQIVQSKIVKSEQAFIIWRKTTLAERQKAIQNVQLLLQQNKQLYATTITQEMGKPLAESHAEIEKCILLCQHYILESANYLAPEHISLEGAKAQIVFHPLGTILGIMPWNFPFWQVFRYAIPALLAGNTVLLKHAPNVMGTATLLDELFKKATTVEHIFQNLKITENQVAHVIANPIIKAISYTGSEKGGIAVGQLASQHIKKCVMELGGSNAFIILDDANLPEAITMGAQARLLNTGQSCIAAKRFILHEKIAEAYITGLKNEFSNVIIGDPHDVTTKLGVIAREDLADKLEQQVHQALTEGAQLVIGGKRENNLYYPTILSGVTAEMAISQEEVFGPVALVFVVSTDQEAITLANTSPFGLGASVFTQSNVRAQAFINALDDGAVFINSMVFSNPKIPFGGTKKSGYGRELGEYGIKEFVNAKTVVDFS